MSFLNIAASMLSLSSINRRVHCHLHLLDSPLFVNAFSVYKLTGSSDVESNMFSYDILFISDESLDIATLCDTKVSCTLQDELEPLKKRVIEGYACYVAQHSMVGLKYAYHLRMVSALYYLSKNRRYEIYQDKNGFDIIKLILSRYATSLDISLNIEANTSQYSTRHYCTQYNQSDYEFIKMLCEEEGLSIISDSSSCRPLQLTLCPLKEHTTYHGIVEASFDYSKEFAISGLIYDYYDFLKPSLDYSVRKSNIPNSVLEDNNATKQLHNDLYIERLVDRLDIFEGSLANDLAKNTINDAVASYNKSVRVYATTTDVTITDGMHILLNDTKLFKQEDVVVLNCKYYGVFANALDEFIDFNDKEQEQFYVEFESIPSAMEYKPSITIPKPKIYSIHTAIVSKGNSDAQSSANDIDIN